MASAAGESGAGGGDHCPSGEKGTSRVGRRSKSLVLFIGQRSVIWKKNIENVWQGARKTYVLLSEFLSFMLSTPLLSSVMD